MPEGNLEVKYSTYFCTMEIHKTSRVQKARWPLDVLYNCNELQLLVAWMEH